MLPPAAQAVMADGAHRAHAGGVLRGLARWLGGMGIPAATAVLVGVAIAAAMLLHFLIGVARGVSFGWGFAAEIAAATILIATPFVVFAQLIIRRPIRWSRSSGSIGSAWNLSAFACARGLERGGRGAVERPTLNA